MGRALDGLIDLFGDGVLPFATDAARRYPELDVTARAAARGLLTPVGYIAAVAASRGFVVASRDASTYEAGVLHRRNAQHSVQGLRLSVPDTLASLLPMQSAAPTTSAERWGSAVPIGVSKGPECR